MATLLDDMDMEHFHYWRKFYWTVMDYGDVILLFIIFYSNYLRYRFQYFSNDPFYVNLVFQNH